MAGQGRLDNGCAVNRGLSMAVGAAAALNRAVNMQGFIV